MGNDAGQYDPRAGRLANTGLNIPTREPGTDREPTPFEQLAKQLDQRLAYLQENVSALGRRLQPIRMSVPERASTMNEAVGRTGVGLLDVLRSIDERVAAMSVQLETITGELVL